MTHLLLGKPVADQLFLQTKKYIDDHHITGYLAIFVTGEKHPGTAYVKKKVEYAEKLGLTSKIYTNEKTIEDDITSCNMDNACLGIIIQLPLPSHLGDKKREYLNLIDPLKDPDCLGEALLKRCCVYGGDIAITPATPSAVLHILEYYHFLQTITDYHIAILGESMLVGKPLADILEKSGAYVQTFNEFSDQAHMRRECQKADIIISATGKTHLVNEEFVRKDQTQIIIDIGRGYHNGKPAGDVHFDSIVEKVAAITPVPGGVGPVTVASLFWNMIQLHKQRI